MEVLQLLAFALVFLTVQANGASLDGHEFQEIVPFIGNGTPSLQMQFMVSIRRASQETADLQFGQGHICGGVILSRNHILTAASCIQIRERIPDEDILIIAGTRYRYDAAGAERHTVRNITVHPHYTFNPLNNNLAIILLNETLQEDLMTVAPIAISNSLVPANLNCQIYGWGLPSSMNGPRELLTGNIVTVTNDLCTVNMANRFCAGPDYISGCAGDDGGPVVCNNQLVGLIDFTDLNYCNTSSTGRHTAYINIAAYHEWIIENMAATMPESGSATQAFISSLMLISSVAILKFFN